MNTKNFTAILFAIIFFFFTSVPISADNGSIHLPLKKTPPKITFNSVNVGAVIQSDTFTDAAYAKAITEVLYNSASLPKGAGGFIVFEPQDEQSNEYFIQIDKANVTSDGMVNIQIKAAGYKDAISTVAVSPKHLGVLKFPPDISANNVEVGRRINIFVGSDEYLSKVTSVVFNGKNITDIAKSSPAPDSAEILVDESYNNTCGTFTIKVIAAGYLDATCNVTVTAAPLKKPPTLTAKDIYVGEYVVITTGDPNYANAVTAIALDSIAFLKTKGDFSVTGGDIKITKDPTGMAGTGKFYLSAPGYSVAECTLLVKIKPLPKIGVPMVTGVTVNQSELKSTGGYVTFTITGKNLKQAKSLCIDADGRQANAILPITDDNTVNIGLTLPANSTKAEQTYRFIPILDGVTQSISTAVTVAADVGGNSGGFVIGYADSWALPEINKTIALDLIPQILNNTDLTKPMTREEFCELSVRLYEKLTGKLVNPAYPNPFKDTANSQVLKAYTLGITSGTSDTAFSPNTLINREQCAAMLFRTIKLIKPNGDYSVASVKDFPDKKCISAWAVNETKYMSKIGIIKGDSNGSFMPKPLNAAQIKSGYGMAKREEAILMGVRTYEELSK